MAKGVGYILADIRYLKELEEEGYRYIAMDKSRYVYAYTERPNKDEKTGVWQRLFGSKMKGLSSAIFSGLSWEDMEATPIADKIKEYEWVLDAKEKESTNEQQSDMVNHPSHYTWKARECKDIQKDMVDGLSGMTASYMTNIIKYLYRVGHKDNVRQDLEKAKKNIDFMMEEMEREHE